MKSQLTFREPTMLRVGAWALGALVLFTSLLLVVLFVGKKSSELWNLANVVQIASVVLALVAIGVAVSALQMALATYRKTEEAIRKQQAGLDASRKAIETIVEAVHTQNNVIESSVAVSKFQFDLLQQQARLDQQRLGRKPSIALYYGDEDLNKLAAPVEIHGGESMRLRFAIRNNGDATAHKGTVVAMADRPTILIDQGGYRVPEKPSQQRLQISMPDLLIYSQTRDHFFLDLDVHGSVPTEFSLSFSLFGENFETVRRKISFRVVS